MRGSLALAPEDRGVFDDMNFAANAIEPRKAGTLRDLVAWSLCKACLDVEGAFAPQFP